MSLTLAARLLSHLRSAGSAWRVACARGTGAIIGPGCEILAGADVVLGFAPARRGELVLGAGCSVGQRSVLHPYGGSIRLGRLVHLGPGSVIYGHGGVEIGDECLFGPHCRVFSSDHAIPPVGTAIRSVGDIPKPTRIGRDVWLGAGVTVLGGVAIGDGCVIGAGAVVSEDLPPGVIALGVPAKVRGQRPS